MTKTSSGNDQKTPMSRRGLLLCGGVAAAGSALGAACDLAVAQVPGTSAAARVEGARYAFEVAPPPVPEGNIVETVTKDVIVVGFGPAGGAAAIAAAQKGASVVVLEAYHKAATPGGAYGALNSRRQARKVEIEPIIDQLVDASVGRADRRLLRVWAENCGRAVDWMADIGESLGAQVLSLEDVIIFRPKDDEGQGADVRMAIPYGEKLGIEYRYNIRGRQLIRGGGPNGRVTGVVATNADGKYIRFVARKAIILTTGTFHNDAEMMEKYCPWVPKDIIDIYDMDTGYGDGQKMALWAGAEIRDMPAMAMIHPNSTNKTRTMKEVVPGQFMFVNRLGERFTNEGAGHEQTMNAVLNQPGSTWFKVFDAKAVTSRTRAAVEAALKSGEVVKGDTIEGLALALGADPQVFAESVKRWNEFIGSGVDHDFGRDLSGVHTASPPPGPGGPITPTAAAQLDTGPYYVEERPPNILAAVGGPTVNEKLQVLDVKRRPIPGLYAAGNCISGLYGDSYPIKIVGGLARSAALTFGYLAGSQAAEH